MVEGEMNDAVRPGGASLEAVQVLSGAAMDLGPGRSQRRCLIRRTTQTEHLMTRGNQLADYGHPDEAGGTRNEYTHERDLQVSLETNLSQCIILVK
jgi:hypothetical protein